MRIISGKYRGKKLLDFDFDNIRPTTDFVKENIFNILQTKIYDAKVLDLFCGSGALGIEAISRGAKEVVFCDADKRSIKLTMQNLSRINETATCTLCDFVFYLKKCCNENKRFDVIFLDPPYASDAGKTALNLIAIYDLLEEGGVVIYENDTKEEFEINKLNKIKRKKYGNVFLDIFEKKMEI